MGLDNPLHIAFLVVVLLLIFGAKRLPEMGRALGEGMRGFKSGITGDEAKAQPTLHATQAQAPPPPPVVPQAQPVATATDQVARPS
ncbi:MAG TPA: twin-arginine translocase TatA/TatE family subunit [Solirubrobacteraceae bacterium]|jgi:sec-independent protein translocase protein TatA|nr:twin-arginine translocase TatA/TatE family subunit [Solirubrobacteraceae bacterium]